MKKLNYRLIVSDYDSTLTNKKSKIPKKVKKAIAEYVANGGIFVVCSGRILRSVMPRAKALGLNGLVAANQGTVIADIKSGKILKSNGMTAEQAARVCRAVEEINRPINLYSGDDFYSDIPKSNKYLKKYEKIVKLKAIHVEGKVSDFAEKSGKTFQKVMIMVMPADRQCVYDILKDKLGKEFDVTCSASELVEVSPLGETKGKGVEFIAQHYGIPLEETIAVGDNLNDLSMIRTAGLGICVGNGVEELKNAADYVSVTSDNCAIAQIIARYGYK